MQMNTQFSKETAEALIRASNAYTTAKKPSNRKGQTTNYNY